MLCSFLCLIATMQRGPDIPERLWALQRLREHGGASALPYIAAVALNSSEPSELRAAATEALAAPRRASVAAYLEPLADDPDAPVRSAAFGSLAALGLGDPERLQRAAMTDAAAGARLQAARALASLDSATSREALRPVAADTDSEVSALAGREAR